MFEFTGEGDIGMERANNAGVKLARVQIDASGCCGIYVNSLGRYC